MSAIAAFCYSDMKDPMSIETENKEKNRAERLMAGTGLTLLNAENGCELGADLDLRSLTYGHLFVQGGGIFGGGGWVQVRKLTTLELEQAKGGIRTFSMSSRGE